MMFCRVCLQKTSGGFPIFETLGLDLKAPEVLTKRLWFQPKQDDPISTNICHECWRIVQSFDEFYVRLEAVHKAYFANYMLKNDQGTNTDDEADPSQNIPNGVQPIEEMVTVKPEVLEVNNSDSLEVTDPLKMDYIKPEDFAEANSWTAKTAKAESKASIRKSKRKKQNGAIKSETTSSNNAKLQMILNDRYVAERIKIFCDICQQEPGTLEQLLEHKRLEHAQENPSFTCCNRQFFQRFNLRQHVKNKHSNNTGEKCPVCEKVVLHLKKHLLCAHVPEEELKFACDKCPRKFSKGFLLKTHKERNLSCMEEPTILCERCHKKFANMYALKRHMTVHQVDGEAVPWENSKCPKCNKVFPYPHQLKEHMSVHGEGPIKCNICHKGFSRKLSLAKHQSTYHSEENEAKRAKRVPRKQKNEDINFVPAEICAVVQDITEEDGNSQFD